MDELSTLIIAGSLIPAISFLVKKFIVDKIFSGLENEISIKDVNGKIIKFTVNTNTSNEEIRDIFESELQFEETVERNLNDFIRSHSKHKIQLSHGKNIDFLLHYNNKKIGIEAKANANRFKAKWISNYFKENKDIDELIIIINSKIPHDFIKEINNNDRIKFISSPKGKGLSKSINNVLEADLKLNKT
ncbi:hypothetical protein [Aeromonas sp. sif2416]|uniref:hypothetical protein n=1 Tax=Aeromonas sp. sif2416 TaxID=2854793 RepID=UPI001C460A7D|nr:hypothetical protein [Aeromonas sp. sif2416]MBV7439698.1 hypothetical protein [Aeromonas sp. sif2416]